MSDDELNEGVTPVAKVYSGPPLVNKTDPFKGDPPPGVKLLEMKYVDPGPYIHPDKKGDTIKIRRPRGVPFPDMPKTTTIEHMADEMLNEVVRKAKPAQLDNLFTTDEELQDLARQVEDRTIKNWPMLRRLLNRLLRAEGK